MNIKRTELIKSDQLNSSSQITFVNSGKETKYSNNKNKR